MDVSPSAGITNRRKQLIIMKTIGARRVTFRVGDFWESPILHILLTKEDNVVVARCLDFTVSVHGQNEKNAMKSLTEAIGILPLTLLRNVDKTALPQLYIIDSKSSLPDLKSQKHQKNPLSHLFSCLVRQAPQHLKLRTYFWASP